MIALSTFTGISSARSPTHNAPHLAGQIAVPRPSCDDIYLAAPVLGYLKDHMRRGPKTIQGQLSSGRQMSSLQGSVSDDPAHKRGAASTSENTSGMG